MYHTTLEIILFVCFHNMLHGRIYSWFCIVALGIFIALILFRLAHIFSLSVYKKLQEVQPSLCVRYFRSAINELLHVLVSRFYLVSDLRSKRSFSLWSKLKCRFHSHLASRSLRIVLEITAHAMRLPCSLISKLGRCGL